MTEVPPREFTGRDLVEALQEAAHAFGVRRSELGHEILEEGRKGFLGIGSRECIIRAWPRANVGSSGGHASGGEGRQPLPPEARRDTGRPDGGRPQSDGRGGEPRGRGRDDRGRDDRGNRGGRPPAGPRGAGGPRAGGPRDDRPRDDRGPAGPRPPSARPDDRSRGDRGAPNRGPSHGPGFQPGASSDEMPARLSDRPIGARDERPGRRRPGGTGRRDERGPRGGDRGSRGPRSDRGPGADRGPRSERGPAGDRGPRPDRGPADDRGPRPDRSSGGDRGPRPDRSSGGDRGPRPDRGAAGDRGPRRPRAEEGADWDQRGGGGRRAGGSPPERRERPQAPRPPRRQEEDDRPAREATVPATDLHASEVRDLLEEIVDRWGLNLEVTSAVHEDTVTVSLDGADANILADDDGRVLEALQYLISKMTSRLLSDNVRVLIDAGGHREKRDQAIRGRALEAANQAKESGRKVRLEPLSPYERRVVHITLKEFEGLRTYSIGRGYLKRVTIEPDGAGHDETDEPAKRQASNDEAE